MIQCSFVSLTAIWLESNFKNVNVNTDRRKLVYGVNEICLHGKPVSWQLSHLRSALPQWYLNYSLSQITASLLLWSFGSGFSD